MSNKERKEQKPLTIAHLVNPFKCKSDNPSYIYYAQPITFETMRIAKKQAQNKEINIKLCAITFPEDDEVVPSDFIKLPNLQRSTITLYKKKAAGRKLPIIQEMINNLKKNIKADYYILTNIDISVQPHFYIKIAKLIRNHPQRNMIINRRNNIPKFRQIRNEQNKVIKVRLSTKPEDLKFLFKQKGTKHPGNDCFVINKTTFNKINMGNLYTGFSPWGNTLQGILQRIPRNRFIKMKHNHLTFHIGKDNPRNKRSLRFRLKKTSFF